VFDLKKSSSPLSIVACVDLEGPSKSDDKVMAVSPRPGRRQTRKNSADHSVIDAHYQWDGRGDKRATVIYENLCKEFTYTGTAALSREYETHGKLRERGGHWELPK